jgi:5-methylcytosine-specific restriction endonuclease McrA
MMNARDIVAFSRETKEVMLEAYSWMCATKGCYEPIEQFHHIIPDDKVNNKLYPLYTQSPFNCFPICIGCHMNKPLPEKPSKRLIQLFEKYLTSLQALPSKPH